MINENDVVEWIRSQAQSLGVEDKSMGSLEKLIERVTMEPRRRALEQLTQQAASSEVLGCPKCGAMLNVDDHRRSRSVLSWYGMVRYMRSYGLCPHCQAHFFPADSALGLHERAPASPRVQELCALTTLHSPAGQAADDLRRTSGMTLASTTMHREARRQGERALDIRQAEEKMTETPDGISALAAKAPSLPLHGTLVIELDAWNIRERDYWGETEKRRKKGEEIGRWHWVYLATIFRLDQRSTKESGRPVIAERGYVATRMGLESFKKQLHAEALRRGLQQVDTVLVLGDGAVWIWNLTAEIFSNAKQRLDLFHAKQHIWNLAGELHGQGTPEAAAWAKPYLNWFDKRTNGVLDVIQSLDEIKTTMHHLTEKQKKAITSETAYFNEHKERMDYKKGKKQARFKILHSFI